MKLLYKSCSTLRYAVSVKATRHYYLAANDTVVPTTQSKKFFHALRGPKKFVQLTHADHHLSKVAYTDEVLEEVLAWLNDSVSLT